MSSLGNSIHQTSDNENQRTPSFREPREPETEFLRLHLSVNSVPKTNLRGNSGLDIRQTALCRTKPPLCALFGAANKGVSGWFDEYKIEPLGEASGPTGNRANRVTCILNRVFSQVHNTL
jgi:hypothetical protein